MTSSIQAFEVSSLDLSGADSLSSSRGEPKKAGPIYKEGVYNLKIKSFNLESNPKLKDGAGKQWGQVRLHATDIETGRDVYGSVSVPMEALLFTNKKGQTSNVKTKIFLDLIESATGERLAPKQIQQAVIDLPKILTNATITAKVGYGRDAVIFTGKTEEGGLKFGIQMKSDGSAMVDADGNILTFASREEAAAYYKSVHGYNPAAYMEILNFRRKTKEA